MFYINQGIHESAGSFVPTDLANLRLWLKADAITGLSNNDPIDTWADSSGNGYDATSTSTKRPLYITNVVNSLPVVRFDGSNDVMSNSGMTGVGTGDFHVFIVHRRNGGAATYRTIMSLGSGGSSPLLSVGPAHTYYVNPLGSGTNVTDGANVDATWEVYEIKRSSGTFYVKKMGGSETSGALTSTGATGYILSGYTTDPFQPYPGDVAEIVVYTDVKSGADLTDIETYFTDKYAL